MATVKLTTSIIERVSAAVYGKCVRTQELYDLNNWGSFVYNHMFSHLLDKIKKLPAGITYDMDTFVVESIGDTRFNIKLKLARSMPWPKSRSNMQFNDGVILGSPIMLNYPVLRLDYSPVWDKLKHELIMFDQNLETIRINQAVMRNKISSKLNQSNTLNAVVKAIPELFDMLPDDIQARLNRKSSANKVVVDTKLFSEMTTVATLHKLRGGFNRG